MNWKGVQQRAKIISEQICIALQILAKKWACVDI